MPIKFQPSKLKIEGVFEKKDTHLKFKDSLLGYFNSITHGKHAYLPKLCGFQNCHLHVEIGTMTLDSKVQSLDSKTHSKPI